MRNVDEWALKQAIDSGATYEEYCDYVVIHLELDDSAVCTRFQYWWYTNIKPMWGWGEL